MGNDQLKNLRALVSDVDGVMTGGQIYVGQQGETRVFNVRDGMGIKLLQKSGLMFAILSGRQSMSLSRRAAELGVEVVKSGRLDKQIAFREIEVELGIPAAQIGYIGDDLPDLAPLALAGVGFCPSDAVAEVRAIAHHILPSGGGEGVVRDAIEMILKAQDKWRSCVEHYEVKHD